MTNIKIEWKPIPELLALDTGDTWHDWPVLSSIPGSRQAVVEIPNNPASDDGLEAYVDALLWPFRGEWVDWRVENQYGILGFPDVGVQSDIMAVGDTFPLHGLTDDVYKRGKFGAGATIAVVDTGCDATHIAFQGINISGDLRDGHGHGTHCASTAASKWGIASQARLLIYKALEDNGWGSESAIANAIRAAAEAGAQVISLSLGGSGSQVMDDACTYAKTLGSIVVVAAGNSGSAPIGSPARAADLIVMAHDRSRTWASFTQGRGWSNPNRVGANGVGVQAAAAGTGSNAASMSGTSMSTPHVAGKAALLRASGKSRNETLSYLLSHGSNPPDGPGSVIMAPDFGQVVTPPPPPPTETDAQAIRRILGHVTGVSVHFSKGAWWNMDVSPP